MTKSTPLVSPQVAKKVSPIVSSEQELLICVDEQDQSIGSATKSDCHDGAGTLHRAFSIFIFNPQGQLLLQQRAKGKRLWPAFWSNSCCSHPRWGEDIHTAANRRLTQELGISAELQYLYKFEYAAHYQGLGSEHELCSVFVGSSDEQPKVNANEISSWRWVEPAELTQALQKEALQNESHKNQAQQYTPWLQLEWQRLQLDFRNDLPSSNP
jgi:isopentenyl-diphosphate delta-isomerase